MGSIGRTIKQNTITTGKLDLINIKNMRLLDDFINYLKSIGRSERTWSGYRNDLEIFYVFLLENCDNKFFGEINKKDIVNYQSYLMSNQNSSARIRRLKGSISSMSNYICNILDDEPEFYNFRNIVNKVESPPKSPKHEKTVLTEDQVQLLLDTLVSKGKIQQACVTALAAFGGSRKSELARFKVDYFKPENIIYDALYKTPEKIITKGQGGGSLLHKYTLVSKFKPYLDLWLQKRNELGIEDEWLFVTKNKGIWSKMKPDTLNSYSLTNSQILGVDFYYHSLRHNFVTYLVKSGLPDSIIVSIIGWKDAKMLGVYDDNPIDDKFGKWFDKDGIKQNKQTELSDL